MSHAPPTPAPGRGAHDLDGARSWWLLAGVALLALALLFPRDWYDELPRRGDFPSPPLRGVTLLQIALAIQGLALMAIGRWRRLRRPPPPPYPASGMVYASDVDVGPRAAAWLLAGVTLIGAGLRFWGLGSELWLDEIAPLVEYAPFGYLDVIATYNASNNHLLNTLLGKASVGAFGESEWAVRLPAVVFGALTVPALYFVSRAAVSRLAALGAALLLAVSYHHIFFSQNARGYAGHVLFSLLCSAVLARALVENRVRQWAVYAVLMVANVATLLHGAFVLAAHVLVAAGVLASAAWRARAVPPALGRTLLAFAATGLLVFDLYATALPQAYVYITHTYAQPSSGFSLGSGEFIAEVVRGLAQGLPPGALAAAVPAAGVAAWGALTLWRRAGVLMTALVLPVVLTGLTLLLAGLTFTPRFFVLALPIALLCGVAGVHALADRLARFSGVPLRTASAGAALLLAVGAAVSAAPLRRYYAVPKQPYREAIAYAESIRPADGIVVAIHLVEAGYRYYGTRAGLQEGRDFTSVRSVDALERVLARYPRERVLLTTTLERFLASDHPDLERRIGEEWRVARTFPATIGGGEISVWTAR